METNVKLRLRVSGELYQMTVFESSVEIQRPINGPVELYQTSDILATIYDSVNDIWNADTIVTLIGEYEKKNNNSRGIPLNRI